MIMHLKKPNVQRCTKIFQICFRNFFAEISHHELETPLTRVRNRPYLPGSTSDRFPEFLSNAIKPHFKAIKATSGFTLTDIGREFRGYVDKNIGEYQAILLTGLPIKSAADFNTFSAGLGYETMLYEAGSGYRNTVVGSVTTASNDPDIFTIEPHNEMSYLPVFPSKLMFCCLSKANVGGESPIVFNRELLAGLEATLVQKCQQKQICYLYNLPHQNNSKYITWQSSFLATSEQEAEQRMTERRMQWEWRPNGDLVTYSKCDAVITHPVTKETIWFNQIHSNHYTYYKSHPMYDGTSNLQPHQYHYNCTYGDGEQFEEETLEHIRQVTWNSAMNLMLQPGDVIMLDNMLVQHSRMGFEGDRKVVVHIIK